MLLESAQKLKCPMAQCKMTTGLISLPMTHFPSLSLIARWAFKVILVISTSNLEPQVPMPFRTSWSALSMYWTWDGIPFRRWSLAQPFHVEKRCDVSNIDLFDFKKKQVKACKVLAQMWCYIKVGHNCRQVAAMNEQANAAAIRLFHEPLLKAKAQASKRTFGSLATGIDTAPEHLVQ